jgi:uncharacterized protein YqjF (DUF2071 family)
MDRPAMDMSWHDLLFIHWAVKPEELRPLIPQRLALDTFEGEAWLGVVPFRMTRVKPHRFPSIPMISAFPELNVRTYVSDGIKPGVWFFSLDAANPFAVAVARRFYYLPYFHARMSLADDGKVITYRSNRTHRGAAPAQFEAEYAPRDAQMPLSSSGSLAFWLTERYCLYAVDPHDGLWRSEIHHPRWPLQSVSAEIAVNTMTAAMMSVTLPDTPPLLHFARRLDVMAWKPQRILV